MEFDTITVTNPNGTISEYTNSYPFLLQSGVFDILKENFSFGDQNSDGLGTQNQTLLAFTWIQLRGVELSLYDIFKNGILTVKTGVKCFLLGEWLND